MALTSEEIVSFLDLLAQDNTLNKNSETYQAAFKYLLNKAGGSPRFNPQTDSYTLKREDAGRVIEINSAGSEVVTVPKNEDENFEIGDELVIIASGDGVVSIEGDIGVTIRSLDGNLSLTGKYAGATLLYKGDDIWYLLGSLV